MAAEASERGDRSAAIVLAVLLLIFVGRVAAQLVQLLAPSPLLPTFSAWQSGALPYGVLLASQVVIVFVSVWVIALLWIRALPQRPRLGLACLVFGAIYFAFMAFRLVAGLTFLADAPFFSAILPAIFHLVLAAMVLIIGSRLRQARGS
jgi:hypothetical protein